MPTQTGLDGMPADCPFEDHQYSVNYSRVCKMQLASCKLLVASCQMPNAQCMHCRIPAKYAGARGAIKARQYQTASVD